MKCEAFLDLAKRLKEADYAREAEFRTSISRAYNYMYIKIRNRYWNDKRVRFRGGGDDKILIRELLGAAKQKFLVEKWRKFHNERNEAEYEMELNFDKKYTNDYIDNIEKFVYDVNKKVKVKKRMN